MVTAAGSDLGSASGFEVIARFVGALDTEHRTGALYRGHADARWLIRPSVFRDGVQGIATREELVRWRTMAARFARPRPANDLEWLVLAQHYGIATPLLDWTTNPLIALFFAADPVVDGDGCIWQFHRDGFDVFTRFETVDVFKDRDTPGLIDAQVLNSRSLAQDSVMSIHSRGIATATDDNVWRTNVFSVPAAAKGDVRSALKVLGIEEERIFDDIAVVVRNFQAEAAQGGG